MPTYHFFEGEEGNPITSETFDTMDQANEHYGAMPSRSYMFTDTAYKAAQEMLRQAEGQDRFFGLVNDGEVALIDLGVHPEATAQEVYVADDENG